MGKPILCLDFDGVIHSYERGWQGGSIYGTLTPGFAEWAGRAAQHFRLAVYSSRSCTPQGLADMQAWLEEQWPDMPMPEFEFFHTKPPAFLTIDDRAVTFEGNWGDVGLRPDVLLAFEPWTAQRKE